MILVVRQCHRIGCGLPAAINGLCRECYCGERYPVARKFEHAKVPDPVYPRAKAKSK